jgi:hypothetical protein
MNEAAIEEVIDQSGQCAELIAAVDARAAAAWMQVKMLAVIALELRRIRTA